MLTKRNLTTLLLPAILCGCESFNPSHDPPPPPPTAGDMVRENNQGYSLLYKLMSDESDVGKILIFKKASDAVAGPVKDIGKSCGIVKKQMDQFHKDNGQIRYDVPDLPNMEQRSRDLQASADTKALLSLSGKEFEQRLVFTQMEAMNYGAQLCKALDEKEPDHGRKAFLQSVGKQCQDFHDRLSKLLTVNS